MDYKCGVCHMFHSEEEWNQNTAKVMPQYVVNIGELGWLHSTYVCPSKNCNSENAGYDIKSEEEFLKVFRLHWKGGAVEELRGKDIGDALKREGYGVNAISSLSYFELVE